MNNNHKDKVKNSLNKAITKMVPAIFTALIATGLGFISLYTSPVPMIQDFGSMLTIGIVISFILAIFLLIPILFSRDYFFHREKKLSKSKKEKTKPSFVDNALGWLTKTVIKFRWIIVIIAVMTAAIGIWVDLDADAETDIETFMPQDLPELKDTHKLREIMGTTDQVSIVYEGKDILSEESLDWINHLSESLPSEFSEVVETRSITSIVKLMNDGELPEEDAFRDQLADIPAEQLKLFLNDSLSKGTVTVGIEHLEAADLENFITDLDFYLSENKIDSLNTTITGKSVLDVEMIQGLTTGRYQMTLLGMGLVFLSLLLIYRHPIKALIPLLPISFIVGWSGLIMYLFDISYTPLTATLGALIIGIGTEFTILIMERYFEERNEGRSSTDAIKITNTKLGKSIFVSALTTIGGFSALLASDFAILSNFGMMTLINVSLALLSTIFIMPAILIILDKFVKIKQTA